MTANICKTVTILPSGLSGDVHRWERSIDIRRNSRAVCVDTWSGQVLSHEQKQLAMDQCVNVLALVKDGERFVFLYDDVSGPELLRTLGRYAADPELSFSWYDAAVLSQRVRRMQDEADEDQSTFRRSA